MDIRIDQLSKKELIKLLLMQIKENEDLLIELENLKKEYKKIIQDSKGSEEI